MRRHHTISHLTLGAVSCALLLLQAGSAHGFDIRRTESGLPVYWALDTFTMVLDPSLSLIGDSAQVEDVVTTAMDTWQSADALPVSFVLTVADAEVAAADHALDGRNSIYAIDGDWPYESRAPAVTILSYDSNTGKILEADIAIDASRVWSLADEPGPRAQDFQDVMTHELGHALGLAHSEIEDATMFERSRLGSIKRRNLHTDDVQALLAVYEGAEILSLDDFGGCSAAERVGTTGAQTGSVALFALFVVIALARLRSNDRHR